MKKIGLGLLLLLVFITGCSQSNANETAKEGDRLQVVASFYPIADFTKRIGGDRVEVETLIGSGVDPHGWEMSTTDRNKVERADLFIYNGAGFEHWVDDLLDGLENKDLQIVEAAERVALMEGHSHDHDDHDDHDHEEEAHDHDDHDHDHEEEAHDHDDHDHEHEEEAHDHDDHDDHDGHNHGPHDAHTWISIRNAIVQMETIKDALVQKDPEHKDVYEKNFAAQKEQFEALDKEAEELFSTVSRTDFIVGHESFGYFARDYGLTQHGIEGAASHGEPDPATMAELVRLARETGIKTVFYDPLGSDKTAKTIADEIGGQVAMLNPLDGRSEEEIAEGLGTLEIMKNNIQALHKALTE